MAVGAHADDIEIGAGGTLARFRAAFPAARLHWLVCSAEGAREAEARAAATDLGADQIDVLGFPDRYLPGHWSDLKARLGSYRAGLDRCDLVLAPWREDRHQDHRVLADLVWQTFRRTSIWAYEIVKFEGDLGHPNLLVDLTEEQMAAKVDVLHRSFPSQAGRDWFDTDTFRSIARIRGVEAGSRWAEGFHVEKLRW